ncbi:MAG: M56 family metallopeptidase [Clostridiales bacterium]|nr:M56 family metallopeptidase [Clostridiales bacterium]
MLNILICSMNMSIVAVIYLIVSRVLSNKQSPSIRYYSWLVVIIGFLIPIRPHWGSALVTLENTAPANPVVATNTVHTSTTSLINPMSVVTAIYLIGAVSFILFYIIRSTAWNKTVMRFAKSAPSDIQELTSEVSKALKIKRPIEVYTSECISSPMMTGLINPIILIPCRSYGYNELRLIIKHELTHYKHHDLWIKLFITVCRTMHWFNPLMIVISRKLEQECEYYCDMAVTSDEDAQMRKVYCESILNTVSATRSTFSVSPTPAITTNFYSPKQSLKHRLQLILSGSRRLFIGTLIAIILLTCISGFAIASKDISSQDSSYNDSYPSVTTTIMNTPESSAETTYWIGEEDMTEVTTYYMDIDNMEVEETSYVQYFGDETIPTTTTAITETTTSMTAYPSE